MPSKDSTSAMPLREIGALETKAPLPSATSMALSARSCARCARSPVTSFRSQKSTALATSMTLPSATQFPAISFKRGVSDAIYKDHSALLWAVVDIMKSDLAALSSAGVNYIQIDAPRYSYYMDPKWREWIRSEIGMD